MLYKNLRCLIWKSEHNVQILKDNSKKKLTHVSNLRFNEYFKMYVYFDLTKHCAC